MREDLKGHFFPYDWRPRVGLDVQPRTCAEQVAHCVLAGQETLMAVAKFSVAEDVAACGMVGHHRAADALQGGTSVIEADVKYSAQFPTN